MHEAATRMRLSVAMIVRDAADGLRLSMASVQEIADELVVVDTGSTDKSREVAREFGARVYDWPWSDDFSAARNFAAGHVTGDWTLWLDAGETLSDSDARDLRQFLATEANPRTAYMMLVRLPAADDHSPQEQVARLRLLPRHERIQFQGRLRESCDDSLAALGLPIQGLPYLIRRGEREHDPRVKKRRAQRNIRLIEHEQREQGLSPRLWNCLGEAAAVLGDQPRAAACYEQSLASAERGTADMLEAYYGLLTALDADRDRDRILRLCMEALEVFPLDAQLLCALGGHLYTRGQAQLAQQAYLTAYRYGHVQPQVWHIVDIRDVSAVCYSVSLQLLRQQREAAQFLEEALRDHPQSVRMRRRLVETYIDAGEREAALTHVGQLPGDTPHLEALRSAVRGACYASQRNWIAAKAYLNAAYGHGCRDVICLKWLATTLLACGDSVAAKPVLEAWGRQDPRNPEPAKWLADPTAAASDPRMIRRDGPLSGVNVPLHSLLTGTPISSPLT
ncbi:MAG: glycosyltransferase [Pirellulaceae bacterium]